MGIDLKDPLITADVAYIERMIADRILSEMSPEKFPGKNGIQIIRCADGEQVGDLMWAHHSICRGRDCHHAHALNGLPIRFMPESPLYNQRFNLDQLVCEDVVASSGLKNLHESIALYPHWPCGAGLSLRLPIWEQMRLAALGKELLLKYLTQQGQGNMVVVLGLHIDLLFRQPRSKALLNWNRRIWRDWHEKNYPNLCGSFDAAKLKQVA